MLFYTTVEPLLAATLEEQEGRRIIEVGCSIEINMKLSRKVNLYKHQTGKMESREDIQKLAFECFYHFLFRNLTCHRFSKNKANLVKSEHVQSSNHLFCLRTITNPYRRDEGKP